MENVPSSWHGLQHTASTQSGRGVGGGGGVGIPVHRFVYRCSVGPGDKGINRSFLNREVRKEEGTLEQEL